MACSGCLRGAAPSRSSSQRAPASERQRPHKSTSELLLGLPPAEPLNICADEHYCFPSSHSLFARSAALAASKTQDSRRCVVLCQGNHIERHETTLQSLYNIVELMPGFHHSVVVLPLPFRRSRSRCRFRTPLPLPLPLRIFLLFTAVTERNFLT